MRIMITGGAGFIGSAVVREVIANTDHELMNVDCLTYAGNPASLADLEHDPRYEFAKADIRNHSAMREIMRVFEPDAVMHLAAESHVDRSIDGPQEFIDTNIVGTYCLLEAAREYWKQGPERFRFHHVSTDEVYGDLGTTEAKFTESTAYAPRSPYSAAKAASDHLVRAWGHTYGLPVVVSNCSNNYGPRQFPEKLIPHVILNALHGKPLPIYGDGQQVRDWLHVGDHARALLSVLTAGRIGETYNIGGDSERANIDVVRQICALLDSMAPDRRPTELGSYAELITFVADRPGHDRRYAIDASKIWNELAWKPQESFESGLLNTVAWYLANEQWWKHILDGTYRLKRIGL